MPVVFQYHAKRQGLEDRQCSGIQTEGFWSSFYAFLAVIFVWFYFSWFLCHEPPRCSAEPWRCLFESKSDWTLMVTSQPTEVLNVQGWEAALSPTYPTFRQWGVGICVTTRYCFSSFEFGTPQTFVKGIPVHPSCWIPLPWTLSRFWEGCHRETVDVQHAWMEERKMRPLALPAGVSEPSEQQSLQGSYLGPSFRETCLCR